MDEPLSNLDAKLRVQTRAEIARLHQRLETTTVYVTHDQVEAMTMGDRIAVMNDGRLQQVGTPQELYDQPVNRFVAGFIGSPSMNFIDVTARAADGAGKLARLRRRTSRSRSRRACATRSRPPPAGRSSRASGPEHFDLAGGQNETATVAGVAEVVEYLGNEELLHVNVERPRHRRDRRLVAPGAPGRRRHAPHGARQGLPLRSGDRRSWLARTPSARPDAAA